MNYQTLTWKCENNIGHLIVNRPEQLNALNQTVLTELKQFFSQDYKNASDCFGILFYGSGEKAFIAGADIKAMGKMGNQEANEFAKLGQEVSLLIEECPLTVIAAIDGHALGGGLEMAMACDWILATEKSKLGQPEINLGLIPGFGGTQRLIRYIGRGRAKEMIYLGTPIGVQEASQWGLINRVFSNRGEMFSFATKQLEALKTKSSLILGQCKKAINKGENMELPHGLGIEREIFSGIFSTEDTREGIAAFIEKRAPKFSGR